MSGWVDKNEWTLCSERLPDYEAICCDNHGNMLIEEGSKGRR